MTWSPDQPLVSLKDVHKTFGGVSVLKGITMDVMQGAVICIIGPSGSGKSTLLRCVNALVPIDSGSILVEGQEVRIFARRSPDDPRRIQAVAAPEAFRRLCE